MVQLYRSTDLAIALEKSGSTLSGRLDFHMINNLTIAVHALPMYILTSLSVDEILLLRYVKFQRLAI